MAGQLLCDSKFGFKLPEETVSSVAHCQFVRLKLMCLRLRFMSGKFAVGFNCPLFPDNYNGTSEDRSPYKWISLPL